MNCTINDLIISFDVDNRLRSTIGHITGFDLNKAYALAGFLRDAKFKSFLSNRLTDNDVLKDKVVDLSNIKEEDYVNINQNKLGALLNLYYIEKYHSVANSKTVKNLGILNGFSSATAKKIAKEHTAKLLREEYRKEINKPVRRTGAEIVESVNQQLLDTFYENYVELFVEDVLRRNVFSKAAKDYAQHYKDIVEKGKELANLNKRDNSEYKTLAEEIKKFKKGSKEAEDIKKKAKEIQKRILTRNKQMNVLRTDRYVVAQNLVNLYSNNYEEHARERIRNFANLVAQSRGDANGWYYQVFHTKGMTDIYKFLHNVGDIEEFLEYQDANNDEIISKYNDQGIDETSKTWEDHFYKSFEEGVSSALRMELSNIPVITQPYNIYSTEQALDTNNPLGVSTTMNPQLVLTEIFTYGDFSSREAFIESINKRANSVPALYGLGYIVNRMRTNREYLNLMFTNFAKPIFYKSVLTINNLSSETGVSFDYSNPNALPLPEMIFRLTSKLRSTFNDNFDNSDIAKLNEINSKFKSYNTYTNLSELVIELHELISKYFPNIDKASVEKVFTGKQSSEIINSANSIITSINTIIGEMQKIRKKTNDENINIRKRNDERYEAWKKEYKLAKLDGKKALPEQPVYEQFKPVSFDLSPTANKAIISLSKILIENSETKVRLNSTNAEGNSSSDVGKNCYISRFFEAILSDDSNTSRKGLENLLSYITQGVEGYEDQNQYANNPLFFGVKDENGIELCKGMFTRTSSGIVINDNARDILNYHLFDGAKNTATGDANNYANMSKLDYFITQFMAFNNSIDAISNDTKTKEIGEMSSAVYPMRVASDAPKIFFIRAPRYSNKEVRASLYNHVLDELNMFVNGLNNIFKLDENDNTFKTITDITNLYGRAYFDERTANKLRREDLKNGVTTTDYTPAIVDKNGRLVGNMFKFLRLRNLEKYNAEQEIMNIISLYGGRNVNPLIVPDKNGRLRLNENRLSDNDIIRFDGKRIVLNLNAQQKLALKEIVNKWADAYLVEARNKVSEYLDVLKEYGYKVDMNIVNSYLLNNYNMNIAYDDLFEGDYKFYNGARDFLKRMKESQAGGDGYAAYNVLSDLRERIKEFEDDIINIKSSNTTSPGAYLVPIWEGGKIIEKPLSLRSGWRGVTIYNTVKPSDNAKDIAEELEKIFIKQKVSNPKERATIIAKGYFSLAKVNDAQSYITLEEFIRRRYADGTLNMYQDLIGQLLDPNITAEQIDLNEVNARIQVQKNFYFDKVFDKDTGEFVARQIKNAEFVLIPKLLPEGSELRKIYDWMKANDIGQLNTAETSKAAKKSIFTIWDEQTGKFNENFEEDFSDDFIEEYSYQYLYKQQEVPEHMRDTKNKAGTQFIKKIIDNVSTAGEQVQTWAEEFLNAYGANIKEDFNNFLYSVGWDYDTTNGKLFNKVYATTDSFGNPLTPEQIEKNKYNLKMEYFYERFREEATRLGMDSNFMEYLTLNEFGIPIMPNVMNTSMSKLESIAQALWNSGITRQTLSGWHAAQVTDVGYSKRLNFDAKTGVMEVYLPRWSKLIPKGKNAEEEAEIIKRIQEEGLDIQIGYRIPTEGKQSICVLKVVGFTHDALGSTIVVPEDWVVQTGADFDVDSIYGISWEMYETANEDGKKVLKKIPYTEKTTDNKKLYIGYVKNKINENVNREKIGEEIDETLKSIRDELNNSEAIKKFQELFNKLDEERNELYSLLPGKYRGIIADVNKQTPKILKEGIYKVDIKQAYPKIIEQLSLAVRTDNLSDETLNNVLQYIDLSLSLIDVMNQQEGLPAFDKELYKSKKADAIAEIIEKANEAYFNKVQETTKKAGIISFDEFVELPFVERLSRKARNNYILERCINIMMDSSSREEQYMRSNFDDLKSADNKVSDYSGESKRIYNPYDSLDQLDYFEDALGGRALKARSVNWDTFISKMNKVHAILGEKHAVEVILDNAEYKDLVYKSNANEESLSQSRITLNQLGWSENNRNITGSLITAYASQTTAHHLDAVKEGSIKNVNDYTFGVYKFLTAIGLDYEHSIAFIRQPIITRLVNNYNITNSVFFKNSDDPLFMTFRDIAKDLNVYHGKKQINDESSIYDVIQGLQENTKFVEAVNNILGVDISKMTLGEILSLKFPLRKNWLLRRIEVARDAKSNAINASANNAYTLAAMDFSILIMFNGYNNTATTIESYISATTVDKTGAKPEVRETRVQYDTIEKLRDKLDITVDGISLMNAIYPRDDNGQINIEESKYPYLASIFKYVIQNSNAVNTQLFITESEDFTNAEDYIRTVLGRKLTAQEYKEYKRYYINFIYNKLAKILSPITLDERGNIFANEENIDKTSTKYWNDERSRIVGYGITTSDSLSISNVNDPKPDEIEAFAKLTPAQKVIFIQRNFADDQGIFKYINVTLFNPVDIKFRGISRQYLSYSDQVDNIEDLYHLFNESFANKNPLIKLATIDLIKYAFIAEGFNFKSGYISKIITNSSLYTPQNQGGMDIINGVNSINEWLKLLPNLIQGDDFIFKYIRSHSNLIKPIAFKPYPKIVKSQEGYDVPAYQNQTTSILNRRNGDGLIYLNGLTQDKFEKDIIEHKLKLKDNVGRFIKLVLPNRSNEFKSYLYFVTCKNDVDYYLIPLNLLDVYETYDNSYNTNNNQFASYDYYLTKIEDLSIKAQQARKIRRTPSVYDVPSTGEKVGKFKAASQYDVNDATTIIQLTNSSDAHIQGAATKFTERIEKAYFDTIKSGDRTRSIIHQPNKFLSDLFTENKAVIQHIELSNGELIDVTITKLPVTGKFTDLYYGRIQLKNADARHAFDSVISDMKNNGIAPRQTNIYQIEINEHESSPVEGNNMYASTEEISSSSPLAISKPLDIDRLSTTIVRQISYVQRREDSNSADRFIREMSRLHLNANSAESIKEHREDIYKAAAKYYRSAASNILHKLENYIIDEENIFSMDNPELYEKLGEHQELFEDVAYTILDALTFGNKIKDIFNLNLAAEDESTKRSIESIIKSIRDVTQNDIVRQALDNIFNIYLSKYSNNPDIINDLINLRETYGDTDYIYSLITAPTEIANSEVQVVLKQVYSMISKSEMFDVNANLKEWDEELAKIEAMTENIDMNKIIDSEHGKIRQAYTEDFIKDRRKVLDNYNEAKQELLDKYAEVISSGAPIYKELKVAFKKYMDAQYAKDEFLFKYTERPIIDEYYRRDLEIRKKAMTIGKDTFYEYKLLTLMLSDTSFAVVESPEDVAKRKKNIIKRLSNLKSTVDITGSEKPKENALQVAALNNYLDAHKKLQEEFIDVQEYDGFREEYERHNNFIKEYDLKNPHTSLDAKLTDPLYREAYEWIESNGRVGYNKEAEEKLNSVYKVLLNRANYLSKKIRTRLKNIPDLYDEHGVLDARKLNDAQIKALKDEETTDLATMYETGHGEATLIKIVPKNIPLLVKKSTDKKANNILNSLKYTDAALKYKTIQEINEILIKVIDNYTGELRIEDLFNNDIVTEEERIKLANAYRNLRNITSFADKKYKRRKNEVYEDKTHYEEYYKAKAFYDSLPARSPLAKQWLDIFLEIDDQGNPVPNRFIYGYRVPKTEYTDKTKTEAIKFLEDNIEYTRTEYYYEAYKEKQAEGEEAFNKWFKANHVYNPYTHAYQPLKVWTTPTPKPGSYLANSITYIPTFDNMERSIKDGKDNKNYKRFSINYREGSGKYDSGIILNNKEKELRKLIVNTLNKYATTYESKRFVNEGYLPRERQREINGRWVVDQAAALLGLSWHSGTDSDAFRESTDYENDRDIDIPMLQLLKGKGTRKYISYPPKGNMKESEYAKLIEPIKKENEEIRQANLRIDNAQLKRNWLEVIRDFVKAATIHNARNAVKPYLYLLEEDLANNKAYMLKGMFNRRLVKDYNSTTSDYTSYRTTEQTNTKKLIANLSRRIIYDQHHENSEARTIANFLQNMTSAKYMVFNLYGGIANVTTGKVNVRMEEYANEYFGIGQFAKAELRYGKSILGIISSLYSDKAPDLTTAIIKRFNVVNFDDMLQFGAGSHELDAKLKRTRDFMYSFQSMGEHYMQNSVLLAMLDSNRLYQQNGKWQIGDFTDFNRGVEDRAMEEVLADYEDLKKYYKLFRDNLKSDLQAKYDIISRRKDINRSFLHTLRDASSEEFSGKYKIIAEAYNKRRKELTAKAKEEFGKHKTLNELFEYKNGFAEVKEEYLKLVNKEAKNTNDTLEFLLSQFKEKVINTNQKIHGYYDKKGAAWLESTWIGSLIMQYHKHLPMGIMKRYRRKGFHSELRGKEEYGIYQTLVDFLGTEFTNFSSRVKTKKEDGTNVALASIQVTMQSLLNTITNMSLNWNNLSDWEQANMKRIKGDMSGILIACLLTMAMYGLFDDDELKNDRFKASLIYLADRLYSDSTMYTPIGLISEGKTAWSSPIASANGPSDLIKAITIIPQYLFDPEFDRVYKSGVYAGKDKLQVLFRRNIPGVRPYDRIMNITRNNEYYKIGQSQLGINIAKNFGESLYED